MLRRRKLLAANNSPSGQDWEFILPLNDAGSGAVSLAGRLAGSSASFTRATTKWTKLSTGLWTEVASGTACSRYNGQNTAVGSYIGYSSDLAATNLLTYSRDLTNAAWADYVVPMTRAKTATGIDGVANSATVLTATDVSSTVIQTVTAASAERTFSAMVRRKTGTGSVFLFNNGIPNTDITSLINSNTYTRVTVTWTAANPESGFQLATPGDEIEVDQCQLETGAVATSPITTTTAAATRNADVLVFTSAPDFGAQGSAYFEATPLRLDSGTNKTFLSINNNTTNEAIQWRSDGATPANCSVVIVDGGASQGAATVASMFVVGTTLKIAGYWMTNAFNTAAGGTLGTEDTTATMPTTTQVMIGAHGNGTLQPGGCTKNVRIRRRVFPASTVAALTI